MIKQLTKNKNDLWQNLLDNARFSTVFLSLTWLNTVCRPPYQFDLYLIYKKQQVVGGFVLFYRKGKMLTTYTTPPHTPHTGFLIHNSQQSFPAQRKVVDQFCHFIMQLKADTLSFSFRHDFKDVLPFERSGFEVNNGYTYQISLDQKVEHLRQQLLTDKKRNIKKAEKDQLKITIQFDKEIIPLIEQTFKRQKKQNYNIALIKDIIENMQKQNMAYQVNCYQLGKLLSSVFVVYDSQYAYYLFGGFDHNTQNYAAGPYAMWHAILEAQKRALKMFDFEGSVIPHIENYFQRFGAKINMYPKVQYENRKSRFINRIARK